MVAHLQNLSSQSTSQSFANELPSQRTQIDKKRQQKRRQKKKGEGITSCIVHLADSANIKGVTSIKLCSGLTDSCFKSPNDTIHATVTTNAKKTDDTARQ